MTRFAAFVLFTALLALGGGCGKKTKDGSPSPDGDPPGAPNTPTSDKDRFQGVWKMTSADKGDGPKEPKGDRAARLQVEGDRVTLRESATDPGELFTAVWDETKTPKTLALTPVRPAGPPGKPFPGGEPLMCIYKFEGETLVFAQGIGPAPTDFKPDAANGVNILRFQKTDEKPVAPRQPRPKKTGL